MNAPEQPMSGWQPQRLLYTIAAVLWGWATGNLGISINPATSNTFKTLADVSTTPGTPIAVGSGACPNGVRLSNLPGQGGYFYIGSSALNVSGGKSGVPLVPGGSFIFDGISDLSQLYFDQTASSEVMSVQVL